MSHPMVNISDQKKYKKSSMSVSKLLFDDVKMESSNVLKPLEDIEDTKLKMKQSEKNKTIVMQEFQPVVKKKTWKGKLSSSEINIRITELLGILEAELTSREKDFCTCWTKQLKETSEKLLLHTKIDSVDLDSVSSKELFKDIPTGKSWFSIHEKKVEKKSSSKISYQYLPCSHPKCTGLEVINSKTQIQVNKSKEDIDVLKEIKITKLKELCKEVGMKGCSKYTDKTIDSLKTKIITENKTEEILKLFTNKIFDIKDIKITQLKNYCKDVGINNLSQYNAKTIELLIKKIEVENKTKEILELYEKDYVKNEDKTLYKTLKIRLLPTKEEEQQLKIYEGQQRFYYNALVNIYVHQMYPKEKLHTIEKLDDQMIRDKVLPKYKYVETEEKMKDGTVNIMRNFVYDEDNKQIPVPDSWKTICDIPENENEPNVHCRIARGSCKIFSQNINSASSNFRNKNISKFILNYKSAKDDRQNLLFDDDGFPAFFRNIKSRYTYKKKGRKGRCTISFQEIFNSSKKCGFSYTHDKILNEYYIYYSVPHDWYPKNDRRIDNQDNENSLENRIISLDPGIRKFMVGYDPIGKISLIGQGAKQDLLGLLENIDKVVSDIDINKNSMNLHEFIHEKFRLWKKAKNLVNELHWKTIKFLTDNYDVILLPEFKVSEMVRKRNISRETRRLLYAFSFYAFKTKLQNVCIWKNKKVFIVDESYTSKICSNCGQYNDVKSSEIYTCSNCKIVIDRDINGSKNILIKNYDLVSSFLEKKKC